MTINAFEIAKQFAILFAEYDSEWTTDERRAEIEAELDALEVTKEEKTEAYACRIKNLELTAETYGSVIKNLKSKKDSVENAIERLLERLKLLVPEGHVWEKGIRKVYYWPSEKVEIAPEAVIPPQFQRVIPESREPDKLLIKEVLKQQDGFVAEGVSLKKTHTLKVK